VAQEAVVVGRDVWKVYGRGETEVPALQGIDLTILRGEILAIMGPSGCGKTTFLNCFSGLDDITRGSVTLEGVDIHRMSDNQKSDYRARRTGFVEIGPLFVVDPAWRDRLFPLPAGIGMGWALQADFMALGAAGCEVGIIDHYRMIHLDKASGAYDADEERSRLEARFDDDVHVIVLTGQGDNIDTTTASGRLVFGIFAALAEFERELIRERTIAGLSSARARGRNGGRPYTMTPAKLRLAQAAMAKRDTKVSDLCTELGVTRQTLYRFVGPKGELRADATKLLKRKAQNVSS